MTLGARDIVRVLITQFALFGIGAGVFLLAFLSDAIRKGQLNGLGFTAILGLVYLYHLWRLPRSVRLSNGALLVRNVFGAQIARHRLENEEDRDDLGLWLDAQAQERIRFWYSEDVKRATWVQRLRAETQKKLATALWELDFSNSTSTSVLSIELAATCGRERRMGRELRAARDGVSIRSGDLAPTFHAWPEVEQVSEVRRKTVLHLKSGKTAPVGQLAPWTDVCLRSRPFAEGLTLTSWMVSAHEDALASEPKKPTRTASGYRELADSPLSTAKDPALPVRVRVEALSRVVLEPNTRVELEKIAEDSAAPALRSAVAKRLLEEHCA